MASSGASERSRKRPREDDDVSNQELTTENAKQFVERMREAVARSTITEMLAAIERAGPEPRSALVAARGLRRFRQWLMELLPGAASRSAPPDVPPKDQALATYSLKVLNNVAVSDKTDIVDSGVAELVGRIADSGGRVPEPCAEAARALLEHWAREHNLGGADADQPALADPRDPRAGGIATPASAGSSDDELPALVGFGSMGEDDLAALDDLASFGVDAPEVALPVAAPKAAQKEDHVVFDGKPALFGDAERGVLINRKRGVVGGRPWVPRKAVLGEKPSGDAPTAAVEAKQRRKRGIQFHSDLERVRFFLRLAKPTAVSDGDPSDDDVLQAAESGPAPEDEDAQGNVEERRRREQEREKGLDLRTRLAQHNEDDGAAPTAPTAPTGFPTTHVHVPPPLVDVPARLRKERAKSADRDATERLMAQVFEYHTRRPADAPATPPIAPAAWEGYVAEALPTPFTPPPMPSAASAASGAAPRRLGGLASIVSQLSSQSSKKARDDGRDASMSRRSASPGDSLARSTSQAAPAPAAAPTSRGTLSMLSRLSGIVGRSRLGGAAAAAVPTARLPSAESAVSPSPYGQVRPGGPPPHPSASAGYMPPAAAPQPPHTPYGAPQQVAYGAPQPQHNPYAAPQAYGAAGAPPAAPTPVPAAVQIYPPGAPLPPVNTFSREAYDPPNWWHLLPEEMEPPNNRPSRNSPCHFYATIQGCSAGQGCGFLHDPKWIPSRAPKGVDRLWPTFLRDILPKRRARFAQRGSNPAPAPPGQFGAPSQGAPRPGPGGYGSAPSAYSAPLPHSSAPSACGGPSSYGAAPAAPGYGGGAPSFGGAAAASGAPSYGGGAPSYGGGAPGYGGGAPSYGGGAPSYGGGASGYGVPAASGPPAQGYAYGGAAPRPPAAPYQYGGQPPPAQRQAMGQVGGPTLDPSAISRFYGARS